MLDLNLLVTFFNNSFFSFQHLIQKHDNIIELQDDNSKYYSNRHHDYKIEEHVGHACKFTTEDKEKGNLYMYEDDLVEDEETGHVDVAMELIGDKLQDYNIREVRDLISEITAPTTHNRLSSPWRLSPFYNALKDPRKTRETHPQIRRNLFDLRIGDSYYTLSLDLRYIHCLFFLFL